MDYFEKQTINVKVTCVKVSNKKIKFVLKIENIYCNGLLFQ